MPSSEGIAKLKVIQKEIEFIFSQGEIREALRDEGKRRAIFHAIIEIKENIRVLQENNENELLKLFDEQDLKRIAATRNFAAHNSKEINPNIVANLVRFNLYDIKTRIDSYFNSSNLVSNIETSNFQVYNGTKINKHFSPILVIIPILFVTIFALFGFLAYMMFSNSNSNKITTI